MVSLEKMLNMQESGILFSGVYDFIKSLDKLIEELSVDNDNLENKPVYMMDYCIDRDTYAYNNMIGNTKDKDFVAIRIIPHHKKFGLKVFDNSWIDAGKSRETCYIREVAFHDGKILLIYTIGQLKNIGKAAFNGMTEMLSVNIPDSVEVIDAYAFADCYKLLLYNVNLTSSNLRYIGEFAFAQVGLSLSFDKCKKELVLGDNIEELGGLAFYRLVGYDRVVLPKRLREISQGCFELHDDVKEVVKRSRMVTVENVEDAFMVTASERDVDGELADWLDIEPYAEAFEHIKDIRGYHDEEEDDEEEQVVSIQKPGKNIDTSKWDKEWGEDGWGDIDWESDGYDESLYESEYSPKNRYKDLEDDYGNDEYNEDDIEPDGDVPDYVEEEWAKENQDILVEAIHTARWANIPKVISSR